MKHDSWYVLVGVLVVVCLGTLFVRFPVGPGYFNFGDVAVVFAGLALGKRGGLLAGGLGSALADLLGGYLLFAPLTFLAKGAEGWFAGFAHGRASWASYLFPALGGLCMVLVYFLGECLMPQMQLAGAIAEVIPNLIQALCGVLGGRLLFSAWQKVQG